MSDTKTTVMSSAPSNPAVTNTTTNILKGVDTALAAGPKTFNESIFTGAGGTTQDAWLRAIGAANDPNYAAGVTGATSDFADIASGNRFGMNDPGYAALRDKAASDALTTVSKAYNNSGRLGGGSFARDAASGVADSIAALDYANFTNDQNRQVQAAQLLPQLFAAGQQPATAIGAVGAAQDANAQGMQQGRYDLFERQNNAQTDLLAKLTSLLAGNAAASGTTQTTTAPTTPWYQSLLGVGLQAL